MAKEEKYIICGDVDMVGGSASVNCCRCGQPLVQSPASKADQPDAVPICFPCAAPFLKAGANFQPITGPRQLKELTEFAELRPKFWNRRG